MSKFLSNSEIEDIIKTYIDDDRKQQAIVLDGAWASGKTFFVKNQLRPALEEKYKGSDIIMISLYGVDSIDGIQHLLFESYAVQHLSRKTKAGRKIIGSVKLIEAIGQPALDYLENRVGTGGSIKNWLFNVKKLAEEKALKKAESPILIIDDVERCKVDINELLGYIHRLTESIGCNVILICNEKEIQNSEQYNKAKEKVVGLTIPFCIPLDTVFDDIVEKYVSTEFSGNYLKANKQDILSIFMAREHYNLRTLISVCIAVDDIINLLNDEAFTSRQGYGQEITNIINYVAAASITKAIGEKSNSLPQGVRYGTINKKDVDYGMSIMQYAFIDEYLLYQKLESITVRSDVNKRLKEAETEAEEEQRYQRHKNLSLWKLTFWYELPDDDVKKLAEYMLTELDHKEYLPQDFKEIVITLMKINNKSFGFSNEDNQDSSEILYDSTDDRMFAGYRPQEAKPFQSDEFAEWEEMPIESYVDKMMAYFNDPNFTISREMLMGIFGDKDFAYRYREYVKPLTDEINKREEEKLKTVNSVSTGTDLTFDDEFVNTCHQKRQKYFIEGKFLSVFGADQLYSALVHSSPKQIHNFCDGIQSVYNVVNIGDFLEQDLPTVVALREKVTADRQSLNAEKSRTKAIALHRLGKDLAKYEGRLKQDYVVG